MFRLDITDFLGIGMMVAGLSMMTSTSWLAQFHSFSLFRIPLTSAVDTDSGRSSIGGVDLTADSLLRRSK